MPGLIISIGEKLAQFPMF